jgi:hypothetical protein
MTGTKLLSDAGSTMSDIVSCVRKVADVISEITAASAEQSAALVEQSAAAAENLRDQAYQMAQAVAVFKISETAASVFSRPKALSSSRSGPVLGNSRPASPARKPLAVAAR